MNSESPRFFFFDLGNVLLWFDQDRACQQVGQLGGIRPERVRELIFASGLQERYERGELDSRQFFDAYSQSSGTTPDYDAFHLAHSQMFELNTSVIPIVVQMRTAGYPLGILSNTCEAHWRYVSDGRYLAIRAFFEPCVLSFEAKCAKPQAPIYLEAARRAHVEPHEVFLVDDRLENVAAAREVGFDAVEYHGPRKLAEDLRSRGIDFNY